MAAALPGHFSSYVPDDRMRVPSPSGSSVRSAR